MSLDSIRLSLNVRREKVPAFKRNMLKIRQHEPYDHPDAGRSWIALDALEAFSLLLDAIAAHRITPREGIEMLARHLDANAAAMEEDNHDGE